MNENQKSSTEGTVEEKTERGFFKKMLYAIARFAENKGVKPSAKLYFVDVMGKMALGLFSTLLIGTIFQTLAKYIHWDYLAVIADYANKSTGAVIGVIIAVALGASPLVLCSAGVAGYIGYSLPFAFMIDGAAKSLTAGPAGAFVCALIAAELGKLVFKTTKVDIIVVPTVTILSGALIAKALCYPIAYCMYWLGRFINEATELQPIIMGIIVSVVVGIILTLPISSAAICAMIGITGLAGGAATAGCCAQMIGFAVISFRVNGWGGIVAQGLGTSMLQMGNIVKKPLIWVPATLASAITGPIATAVFKLRCTGVSAGMGTCGLVGPLGIIADMGTGRYELLGIALTCIVLPALFSIVIYEIMRHFRLVCDEDLRLEI